MGERRRGEERGAEWEERQGKRKGEEGNGEHRREEAEEVGERRRNILSLLGLAE